MQPDDPYVPIDVVANHFGVSLSTVRAWLNRGYIPIASYIQVGNTRRFKINMLEEAFRNNTCLLYTSPSPRDRTRSRMPSSA